MTALFKDIDEALATANDIDARVYQAIALHEQGQWQAAQILYLSALDEQGSHALALHYLGLIYAQNYHFAAGEAMVLRSLNLLPRWIAGYQNYAQILLQHRQYQRAGDVLKKIIRVNPHNKVVAELLIETHFRAGNSIKALEYAQFLLQTHREDQPLHERVIQFFMRQRQFDRLQPLINFSIKLFPDSDSLLKNQALCYYHLWDLARAREVVEKQLAQTQHMPLMNYLMGKIYMREGNFTQACVFFQKELDELGPQPQIQFALAECLLQLKKYRHGLTLYESRPNKLPSPFSQLTPWRGGAIQSNLLLYAENNLGHTLMWLRYLPLLARQIENDAQLFLAIPLELYPLIQESSLANYCTQIFAYDTEHAITKEVQTIVTQCQLACPLDSLGYAFAATPESLPRSVRYLHVQAERVTSLQNAMNAHAISENYPAFNSYKIKIGVDCGSTLDKLSFIDSSLWRPLIEECAMFGFYQFNFTDDEALQATLAPQNWLDFSSLTTHWHQRACFVTQLDLVVTTNEDSAHLAAALGVTVIYLAPAECTWPWSCVTSADPQTNQTHTDSPNPIWYPDSVHVISYSITKGREEQIVQLSAILKRLYQTHAIAA